jgi:hypothetical protein
MCPCSSGPRQSADPEADGQVAPDSGAGDGAPCHTSSGPVRRDAVLSGVVACSAVGEPVPVWRRFMERAPAARGRRRTRGRRQIERACATVPRQSGAY